MWVPGAFGVPRDIDLIVVVKSKLSILDQEILK